MVELELETHCRTRPAPPHFAIEHGFTDVEWLEPDGSYAATPPRVGEPATARVAAPFFARDDAEFLALYTPAPIAVNGWDRGDGEQLSQVRLVRCRLSSVGPTIETAVRSMQLVELVPSSVFDPIDVPGPAVPTDLSGTLLDPRPEEKLVLVGVDRTLVICTMQGDVTFSFWLRRERPEIFLLEDTSICQGYLYSGNGRLAPELHARLTGA